MKPTHAIEDRSHSIAHDCDLDGHDFRFVGYADGIAFYKCCHCGKECEM